jgi:hypothetical protein
MTRFGGMLFAFTVAAACLMPAGMAAQHTQFVSIKASPAPRTNGCRIVKTKSDLISLLAALHSTSPQIPAIDFNTQAALVVTTFDGRAQPGALGPAAGNPKMLALTFTQASGGTSTGLFVFAVDTSYVASFNGCQVLYPSPAPALPAGIHGTIHTSSGPS